MRKLCFVATDAVSFNVLYRGQFEYLVSNGQRLTLLCGGSPSEIKRLRDRCVGRVVNVGMTRRPHILKDFLSLLRMISHLLFHRYDLVVCTTPKAILLGSVAACLTRQRRRVAFFQGRVYENFTGARRSMYLFFDWLALICSHQILFVSRSLKEGFAVDIPRAARRGFVLGLGSGNGVCLKTFFYDGAIEQRALGLRSEIGIDKRDFVVLVVGRICRDKGLAEIVRVTEEMRADGVKFLIVGSPEGREARIAIERLVGTGLVKHLAFTPDIVPAYALADVHMFLSHREGFGNVAIEAAAMGLPTVAFDVTGVKDSVADGVSGVRLPFGDVKAVVNLIRRLRSDHEYRCRFAGAREWAEQNFSQERVWAMYEDFYTGGCHAGEVQDD